MMKRLTALLGLVVAAACATGPEAVAPGVYDAGRYVVTLDRTWSLMPARLDRRTEVPYLTVDGPMLNQVFLVANVENGESFLTDQSEEAPAPKYRTGMSELEIAEFVTDTLGYYGLQDVEASDVQPGELAGAPGVSFDITAAYDSGLHVRGTALAADVDGGLDLILFVAPAEHYYDAYRGDVQRMFETAARASS